MRYLVCSDIYSESYLRHVAKSVFADIRQDPVSAYLLERGQSVIRQDFAFDIHITTWNDKSDPDVQVDEVDLYTLDLILPSYEHWASHHGVVEPPKWLSVVFENKSTERRDDLNRLWPIYASEVTLQQLALCLWESEEAIATRISDAKALGLGGSYAQQLLVASLISSKGSPSEWVVDMRGFMLSMIAAEDR